MSATGLSNIALILVHMMISVMYIGVR